MITQGCAQIDFVRSRWWAGYDVLRLGVAAEIRRDDEGDIVLYLLLGVVFVGCGIVLPRRNEEPAT